MQAGGHLSSSVSAARSAAEGRGVEGLADGDEGVGDEGAKINHVGTDAFVRLAQDRFRFAGSSPLPEVVQGDSRSSWRLQETEPCRVTPHPF